LINDHSIVVIRNPRKDVLSPLKQLIRAGKYNGQKLNVTVWVVVDITCWLDKLIPTGGISERNRKARKTVKDVIDKEFTIDFALIFDLVLDVSQHSNTGLLGPRFLMHQENYMVDKFLQNFQEPSCLPSEETTRKVKEKGVFQYRAMKCYCHASVPKKEVHS
jgi:hypothetical protein